MLEEKLLRTSDGHVRKETYMTERISHSKVDFERSKSRDSFTLRKTNMRMSSPAGASNLSQMDQLKSRLEVLIKKITLMNNELSKIYQSLQNCVVIIQDWKGVSQDEEANQLKQLLKKAQGCVETTSMAYVETVFRIKEEAGKLCQDWSRQMNQLCTRLEGIFSDCKDEITRKATDLISIKSEMDLFDPAKRIPQNLKSYQRATS